MHSWQLRSDRTQREKERKIPSDGICSGCRQTIGSAPHLWTAVVVEGVERMLCNKCWNAHKHKHRKAVAREKKRDR